MTEPAHSPSDGRNLINRMLGLRSTQYGLAVLATTGAFLLRLGLDPVLGDRSPFLLFTLPILVTALSAGTRPALVAAVLGGLSGTYAFVPPNPSLRLVTPGDWLEVALFSITAALIIRVVNRRAALRAQHNQAVEELRTSEAIKAAILRGALDGIVTTTEDGRILAANPAFCRAFGFRAEDAVGRRLTDLLVVPAPSLLPGTSPERVVAALPGIRPDHRVEGEALRSDRSRFPAEIAMTFTRHQTHNQLTWFIRDVTERKAFEDALRRTTRQLTVVLENASESIFLLDEQGCCVYMNPSAESLTGFTLAEASGRSLHALIHHIGPDGSPCPEADCAIACASRGQTKRSGQEVLIRRNGDFVPVSYIASPIRDSSHAVIGAVIEIRDVTEERRRDALLDENRRQLLRQQQALETLHRLGITIAAELHPDRLVQTVVDAGVTLSGAQVGAFFYNATNDTGDHYVLYALAGAERSAFDRFGLPRATPLFGPTFRGDGVIRSSDILQDPRYGKNAPHAGMPEGHIPVRSYLSVPVASRDGNVIGALFFGHAEPDIFDEAAERAVIGLAAHAAIGLDNARLFEAVEKAKQTLEEKVRTRTQALEEINAELDAFSYTVSHDLRAPLRAVQTLASILLDDFGERLGETGRQYAERIVGAAQRMDDLVQGLLQYSRLARTDIQLQPISLRFVMEKVRQTLERNEELDDAVLDLSENLHTVYANPTILQQVLHNLVTNAIKYRHEERPARVKAWSELRNDRVVRIWIEDNGIGVAPDQLDKIFDVFYRAPGTMSRPGTGIGLAVVKKGTERMDGRCGVESRDGEGSRFWIELPTPN